MQVAFRLAYSIAVAILLILVVVFGSRTLYDKPDNPGFYPPMTSRSLYCNEDSRCYVDGREITDDNDPTLTAGEREYIRDQREYFDDWDAYQRSVFVIPALFGVLAIVAGVALYKRVDGMPLGLVLGGIGAISYGWAESSDGPGNVSSATMFILAFVGLVLVLGVGYWFLGGRDRPDAAADSG